MTWILLTFVAYLAVVTSNAQSAKYLECTEQTEYNPGVCDCHAGVDCLINMTITKIKKDDGSPDENQLFSVNGGRIGPTIIVDYGQLLIVDVFNEISDPENPKNQNISIHWHGMHQWNAGWMDGVGMITQWPTKPEDAFRYVLYGNPAGTHWYHSHMLYQRDEGIVGALIVRDKVGGDTKTLPPDIIDDPSKTMFAVRDQANYKNENAGGICEPDHSKFPLNFAIFGHLIPTNEKPFSINGVPLSSSVSPRVGPTFYVERGKRYRFRIIGIMIAHALRISIDRHKLNVVATDGYLTKSFETDIIIFHVAERYDFVLETNKKYPPGTVFPIRIETVAVSCEDYFTPLAVGYAFLEYTDTGTLTTSKTTFTVNHGGFKSCQTAAQKCSALNCPFENYPPEANTECHKVTELQLLNPTPLKDLPINNNKVMQKFFNFELGSKGALINGIRNELPANIPFVHEGNTKVTNECPYDEIKTCNKSCAHSVYIDKDNKPENEHFIPEVAQFMLSSLEKDKQAVVNIVTHPIHAHGHSYFVAKIAYPKYSENGTIIELNKDITVRECGHGHWTNGVEPSDIFVNRYTVRKDTIIVPAGGYVVIRFLTTNPGWWFMHCHIDFHLNNGMAIAISEVPGCQNPPENYKYVVGQPFIISKEKFQKYGVDGNKCGIVNHN